MSRYPRVKAECALQERTLADLARAVGVKPSSLYNVVNGIARPWPSLKVRLSVELGVAEDELFAEVGS